MKQVEDAEILQKFSVEKTRNEAFNLLLNKYQQKIYWHIRRIVIDHDDTDDLVQETFVKVWKNLANFRSDSQLYTWLYRIALNTAISSFRKKRPQINFVAELPYDVAEKDGYNNDEKQHLIYAIKQLNEGERAIITLYLDELSYAEIAAIIGTSENNIGVKINRIKNKLYKILSHGK